MYIAQSSVGEMVLKMWSPEKQPQSPQSTHHWMKAETEPVALSHQFSQALWAARWVMRFWQPLRRWWLMSSYQASSCPMSGSASMFSQLLQIRWLQAPSKVLPPEPAPSPGTGVEEPKDSRAHAAKANAAMQEGRCDPCTCLCWKPNDELLRSHVSGTGARKEETRVREVRKKIGSRHTFSEAHSGGLAVNLRSSGSPCA